MVFLLASVKRPALFKEDYRGGVEYGDIDAIYRAIHKDYAGRTRHFAAQVMGNQGRPQLARQFHAAIISSRFAETEASGHLLQVGVPDEVIKAARAFMR